MAKTILVVDDNPDILELMEVKLSQAGFEVVLAESAFQALESLEKQVPDGMVLDINMPDRSGVEVLEHIRWEARLEELPVICFTAVHQSEDTKEFIREFSQALMDKSDMDGVVEKMKSLLDSSS